MESVYDTLIYLNHLTRVSARGNSAEQKNALYVVVTLLSPEFKRPLGRPRRKWDDNTKVDFLVIGWLLRGEKGLDCVCLAQEWGKNGGLL
jgi:hypothetical protein